LDYRGNCFEIPNNSRMYVIQKLKMLTFFNDRAVSILDKKKAEVFITEGMDGVREVMEKEKVVKEKRHKNYINEIKEARIKGKNSNARRLRYFFWVFG
jgi:tagatose-1,6-bisphosphate aldolase non-catalytic subunit AgaZ/GatZ